MAERKTSGNAFTRWTKRRRLRKEARHSMRQARRVLRKYSHRVKEEVAEEIERALVALKEALDGDRLSQVRERLEKLDELIDKHLAFGRKSAVREYAESIGIAVLIALVLRAFVVEAFKIPSGSMIPTLEVGDHIFVNKFVYGFRVPFANMKFLPLNKPKRGEVIVFVYPSKAQRDRSTLGGGEDNEGKDFIKRIVAVEGDTVAFEDNTVIVNGKPIPRRELTGDCTYTDINEASGKPEERSCIAYEETAEGKHYRIFQNRDLSLHYTEREPFKVPPGRVFVMGDNRDNSHDSRFWGTVPLENIKGRAVVIWWSYGPTHGVRWRRFFTLVHNQPTLPAR